MEKPDLKCEQCNKSFNRPAKLHAHVKVKNQNLRYPCAKCYRTYASCFEKRKHETTCCGIPTALQNYECSICAKRCATMHGLRRHQQYHHIPSTRLPKRSMTPSREPPASKKPRQTTDNPAVQRLNCRRCHEKFENKRDLYLHGMRTHYQIGQGVQLQPSPYGQGPYPCEMEDGNVDQALKEVYEANIPLILENHREGAMHSVYNKPLTNDFEINELIFAAEDIFQRQQHAFKLTLTFDFILVHTEEKRYRFFKPYESDSVIESPIFISKRTDLQKLRRALNKLNVRQYLMNQRPDTKWKALLISNAIFVIDDTNYTLGQGQTTLPDYVKDKKSIHALVKDKKNYKPYANKLCAYRCLSLHNGQSITNLENRTRHYCQQWNAYQQGRNESVYDPKRYPGLQLSELPEFETCFRVNVSVYQLREDDTVLCIYKSMCRYPETMYLNMFENHLSYIKDFKCYAKKYQCQTCDRMFYTPFNLLRHYKTCTNKTKFVYPGGFFKAQQTIFEKLEECDIQVPPEEQIFPWFIAYDFEAMLQKLDATGDGKLQYTAKHVPISVSLCSNAPGHTKPVCIIDTDLHKLLESIFKEMNEIQETVSELSENKWGWIKKELGKIIECWTREGEQEEPMEINDTESMDIDDDDELIDISDGEENQIPGDDQSILKGNKIMKNQLNSLYGQLEGYMTQIPVLGFNSAKYDINLVKQKLAIYSQMHMEEEQRSFVVKKNNYYACISSKYYKFIDLMQYLSVGTSYSKFLKAYQVDEQRVFFPYQWFDHPDKLNHTKLPPHQAFYSCLKQSNISSEDYQYCLDIWQEHGMTTFRDFLEWYNNLDVGPFVTAVERLQKFYFRKNIDIFKIAISAPGIARRMLFQTAKKACANFALFDNHNRDLHQMFKDNVIGGPSIIFTRYHKSHESFIRNGDEWCEKVVGYDANALYLECIGKPMPVGPFIRRRSDKNFITECRDQYIMAYHWMNYLNISGQAKIQHKLNHGSEKRVGKYLVDGWDPNTNTIYQYQGCFVHDHQCDVTANVKDPCWREERDKKFKKTLETTAYLQEQGYKVIEKWECEFRKLHKIPQVRQWMPDVLQKASRKSHREPNTERCAKRLIIRYVSGGH